MKWIYLTITILVISIGLLFYELRNLDSQYTELIEDGTTQLKMVQRLTSNSNRRHILLFYIAHSSDTLDRNKLIKERDGLLKENDSIFNSLVKIESSIPSQNEIVASVVAARQSYAIKTQAYLSQILNSKPPYIDGKADKELDHYFLEYQKKIDELYALKHKSVLTISDLFTTNMERKSFWISLFSFSPFLVIGALFAILILLLRYINPKSSER
jgi:hypothetical protein